MIRRSEEKKTAITENMRGGDGSVLISAILEPANDELYGHGRLYSLITLNPGCTIGYHVHEGEMEAFFVVSGTADYDDNGTKTTLSAGDVTLTKSGEGHSLGNSGTEPLNVVALILNKPE